MSDREVFLYRCSGCGTVSATTVQATPTTHHVYCSVCNLKGRKDDCPLHHVIEIDVSTGAPMFRLIGWKP